MSVGAFFDKIIMITIGGCCIYLSKAKKEKLGNKANFLKYGGIGIIVINILLSAMAFFKK